MSAAEKLKALQADAEVTPLTYGAVVALWDALPQIMAVVEAAERADRDGKWNADLPMSLAALEKQLGNLGSATESETPTPR